MNNECIIKLIGHRPVYRVVRDRLLDCAHSNDGISSCPEPVAMPLLDRDERHRMLSGTPRTEIGPEFT